MLTSIEFTSLEGFRSKRPSLGVVVISILDQSERARERRPNLSGYRSALEMHFEDTSEEVKYAAPGAWPDTPDAVDQARFAQGIGELVPTLRDAERIFEFVQAHHGSAERLTLLVHCFAGLSRSAAVAKWASEAFGVPMATDRSTERSNPRLLRLLAKVAP